MWTLKWVLENTFVCVDSCGYLTNAKRAMYLYVWKVEILTMSRGSHHYNLQTNTKWTLKWILKNTFVLTLVETLEMPRGSCISMSERSRFWQCWEDHTIMIYRWTRCGRWNEFWRTLLHVLNLVETLAMSKGSSIFMSERLRSWQCREGHTIMIYRRTPCEHWNEFWRTLLHVIIFMETLAMSRR